MYLSVFLKLFDLLIPPRETEKLFENTTLGEFHSLQEERTTGALPYGDERVKALVWEIKYRGNMRAAELAGTLIREQLLAIAAEELGTILLVPIPMHPARRKQRGFNQTELLCETALKNLDIPIEYAPYVLKRIRNTPSQQGLPRHIRLNNIKNSMEVTDPEKIKGRVCVVVDDVSTTGATFSEARRALRIAQARATHCVALAES
jgi:ComF family protein